MHDSAALIAIWGPSSFTAEEYDEVLRRAGAPPWEMGLAIIDDE